MTWKGSNQAPSIQDQVGNYIPGRKAMTNRSNLGPFTEKPSQIRNGGLNYKQAKKCFWSYLTFIAKQIL